MEQLIWQACLLTSAMMATFGDVAFLVLSANSEEGGSSEDVEQPFAIERYKDITCPRYLTVDVVHRYV